MSAMLAKRMGAKKVMVLIQRRAYVDLVQGSVIDIAISPQQATISALLSHAKSRYCWCFLITPRRSRSY